MHPRTPRPAALVAAVAGLVAGLAIAVGPPRASAATTICEKCGSTKIQGGRYVVKNNEWGTDDGQCISASDTGFTITAGNHDVATNGYPSVYAGCHYGNCSTGSGLPLQVSRMGAVGSNVSYTPPAGTGTLPTTSGTTRNPTGPARTPPS